MKPKGLLSCIQEPTTRPHPEPHASGSHLTVLFLWDPSYCYPLIYDNVFSLGISTKILYFFLISPMCATCSTHLIPLDFITLIVFNLE